MGIFAGDAGTSVTLTDTVVRDTREQASDGAFGRGVQVQQGATLSASALVVSGNRDVGILPAHAGTTLTLEDVIVKHTRVRACSEPGFIQCAPAGHGLGSYLGASVGLSNFTISDNALTGIQLATDGELLARDGTISGNLIGVNIQVPGFEIDEHFEQVRLENNTRDIATDDLPVPEIAEVLDTPDVP